MHTRPAPNRQTGVWGTIANGHWVTRRHGGAEIERGSATKTDKGPGANTKTTLNITNGGTRRVVTSDSYRAWGTVDGKETWARPHANYREEGSVHRDARAERVTITKTKTYTTPPR